MEARVLRASVFCAYLPTDTPRSLPLSVERTMRSRPHIPCLAEPPEWQGRIQEAKVTPTPERGSVVVLFSDFLDLPESVERRLAALGNERVLVAVQVLDAVEADFGFQGRVKLRAIEGDAVVTTDAERVREEYLARLEAHSSRWRAAVEGVGGRLVRARTDEAPLDALRRLVQAVSEARR
jgi:uncharacterized protein (DUF58 family)